MSGRSFDENYFDGILRQALIDVEDENTKESEALYHELENEPAIKTSFFHRWRMKRLIRSYEQSSTRGRSFPVSRVALTTAIALVIVFSSGVFANANISKFFQWLGFYSEEYVDISLSTDYTRRIVEATKAWQHGSVYVPGLIPDGYYLENINITNNIIAIEYTTNNGNYFRYNMKTLGDETLASVDNKNSDYRKLKIRGYDAIYFENREIKVLKFSTHEYFFTFTSNTLGERELKKIAENVENSKNLVVK